MSNCGGFEVGENGPVSEPSPYNIEEVVDALRRTGSVHFLLDRVPGRP